MNGQIGTLLLFFLGEFKAPTNELEHAVDHTPADQGNGDSQKGAQTLGGHGDSTQAPPTRLAKNTRSKSSPKPTHAVQRPDPQDVINLPAVLLQGEEVHKQGGCHTAHHQGAQGVHDIRSRANRHQTSQGAVVNKSRIIFAHQPRHQNASHHGHEGVHGHES